VRVGTRRAGVGMLLVWAVALAACAKGKSPAQASLPDSLRWHGTYVSDTLPPVGGTLSRVAHFAVGPDTQAMMAIEFLHRGIVFRRGIWWATGSELTFEPRSGDGTPLEKAFVWRLEGLRLVPVEFDAGLYGAGGIPLTKQPPAAASPPADTATGANR
jgi:hypothetical protein